MRYIHAIVALQLIFFGSVAASTHASVIHSVSGLSSAGVPVSFEAELSILGDTLTVTLTNNSTVGSLNPNDVLGSYYFDIVRGIDLRPALSYSSAIGDVMLTDKNAADTMHEAAADLMAVNAGDYTWQHKPMDATLAPFLGFGVGTVGNSNASPNGFNGNIVDGIDYSIYAGDVTTSNLDGKLLVHETATFMFAGLTGFTEADISPNFAFGLGTAPDSFLVPEPTSVVLLTAGALAVLRRRRTPVS